MVKNKQAKMEVSGGRRLLANKIFSGPDPIGRQKAKAEFNMTPDTTRQYIQELTLYLKQHTKLPDHIVGVNEDDWYENYLILNKNDIQRTKDNLEIYFKLKEILPEAYQERDSYSTVMMKSFRSTSVAWCPKLNEHGHRICVYGHISDTASDFNVIALGNRLVAMMDVLLKEGVDWSSIVLILDTSKTKLGHLTKYPIFLMKKFFDYAWRAYPERIAQIHVIHPPAYLEYAMALFRPFLREKIRSRIMVHSKIDTLYDYVDKSLLPSDYGGDLPYTSVQINDALQDKMKEHEEWLHISKREHRPIPDEKKMKKQKEIEINHNDFKRLTVD
ncbi:hypothetical protein M8J75_004555 [Diaphorina citri]|nr:hypothetical protein M8J75_004555 [Diaphorina citri]